MGRHLTLRALDGHITFTELCLNAESSVCRKRYMIFNLQILDDLVWLSTATYSKALWPRSWLVNTVSGLISRTLVTLLQIHLGRFKINIPKTSIWCRREFKFFILGIKIHHKRTWFSFLDLTYDFLSTDALSLGLISSLDSAMPRFAHSFAHFRLTTNPFLSFNTFLQPTTLSSMNLCFGHLILYL